MANINEPNMGRRPNIPREWSSIPDEVLALVSASEAQKREILPVRIESDPKSGRETVVFACRDPHNITLEDDLRLALQSRLGNRSVKLEGPYSQEQLQEGIQRAYQETQHGAPDPFREFHKGENLPPVPAK